MFDLFPHTGGSGYIARDVICIFNEKFKVIFFDSCLSVDWSKLECCRFGLDEAEAVRPRKEISNNCLVIFVDVVHDLQKVHRSK